jgi:putative ABC transport system permease protein
MALRFRFGTEFGEAVTLALDSIRRHPLRSALTMLGIVIGVATVISVSSVIAGLNNNVIGSIEDIGSNVIICYRFPWATLGRPPSEWFTRKELEPQWAQEIAQLPGVEAAAASIRIFRPEFGVGTSYVRRGQLRAKSVILQGSPPEIEQVLNVQLESGRWFNQAEEDHRRQVVILGHDTAKTLFPEPWLDPIGQEVLVEGQAFTVIGIAARNRQSIAGGSNPEDNLAAMPLSTLRKLYPQQKDPVIFVKATSADAIPQVVDSVRDLLRRKRRLPSNKPDDFAIFTPDAFIELWGQISTGIFLLMFAVSSVALLVGGVGVMNIMLVSVTERTREIGLRKALGARRRNVLWQFLLEASTLSSAGGLIGILVGSGFAVLIRNAIGSLPTEISLAWVTFAFAVCAAIGIVFGFYPAWKASALDPVEALRYE